MPDDAVIAWYRTQPLDYAFAGMLHDLRDPFEAIGTIAALVRHFSNQAAACSELAMTLMQATATLVEHDINADLWTVGQAIAQQLHGQQTDEPEPSVRRTWDQPLDRVVTDIAQRMRATVITLHQTIVPFQETCLACLPAEVRENIRTVLASKLDAFLQQIALLEDVIIPRIKAEVITTR
jgi:hypothetical protein